MKAIKIIILLSVIFSFFSCQEDGEITITNLEIETLGASEITINSAKCGGSIPNIIGALPILSRGVCWGINENPTINDNGYFSIDGQGTGYFTSFIQGLNANTKYYYRAYATNSNGTTYGQQRSFTTSSPNPDPIVITVSAMQTGSDYSDSGFEHNGNNYKYIFNFETTFEYSNTQYADTIGYIINENWYYYTNISNSIRTHIWNLWSNSNNATVTYQAYARKDDGTLILGEKKSLYLFYGGKNLTPQKIHLDLNIDENIAIKTSNIKPLDINIKTAVQIEN